ncbi:YMGG-like glycine zipper-containing protein [Oceanimonas sp. NS1]|nr:YMGG-like glycine zipper-containing protein [Oceanimonas sp. NS1]
MKKICLAVAAALALSACTTNPYTGERQTSKAAIGSGIGALAGAVIGGASASSSDREKGILIGAASGAALGGGVGTTWTCRKPSCGIACRALASA